MDKLEQIKKRIEEIQAKSMVAPEMKAFITLVLQIISKSKEELVNLSDENIKTIKDSVLYLEANYAKQVNILKEEKKLTLSQIEGNVNELKTLLAKVKAIKLTPGKNGKDADEEKIVKKVLSKIPKPNKVVLDTGEVIVDKINDLSTDPENQIDASHIKNLPSTVQQHRGISEKRVADMIAENDRNVDDNNYLKLDQTENPQKITSNYEVVVGDDGLLFSDTSNGGKLKSTTARAVADLVDLSNYQTKTETLTAGENLVAGNVCYLKSDGKYWKALGSAEATTKGRIVMATATISANATGVFLTYGDYTGSRYTAGATYFINTSTAGAITSTTPTTGNFIRVVGYAKSTTVFNFDPSKDYGEVA